MNTEAKAVNVKGDFFEACREVKISTKDQIEAEMLAVIVRAVISGGRITVETRDRCTRMHFGEWRLENYPS